MYKNRKIIAHTYFNVVLLNKTQHVNYLKVFSTSLVLLSMWFCMRSQIK